MLFMYSFLLLFLCRNLYRCGKVRYRTELYGKYCNLYNSLLSGTPIGVSTSSLTFCNSEMILGGLYVTNYQKFIITYNSVPSHTSVIIRLSLYILEAWNGESISISVNSVVSKLIYHYTTPTTGINLCGTPILDEKKSNIENVFSPHSTSVLEIYVENESLAPRTYGIKDIIVIYENSCPAPCATCDILGCVICPIFSEIITIIIYNTCICIDGFYFDQSDYFQCLQCHYSCKTCDGPLGTHCLTCQYPLNYISSTRECVPIASNYLILYEFINTITSSSFSTWTVTGTSTAYLDDSCFPPIIMAGGWGKFGSGAKMIKTYQLLPHFESQLSFSFFTIDNFNSKDFRIKINGNTVYNEEFPSSATYSRDICGMGSYPETYSRININIPSNLQDVSLVIEFSSTLTNSANIGSWGLNNFVLSYRLCHPTCLSCSGINYNECSSCYPNFNFINSGSNNVCECPTIGYYLPSYVNPCLNYPCTVCIPCHISCKTCSDNFVTSCLTCRTGDYFLSGTCVSSCPNGYWTDLSVNECKDCSISIPNCFECTDGSHCTLCDNSYLIENGQCVTTCMSHNFENTVLSTCETCDVECLECSGYSSHCISCNSGLFLKNNNCVSSCLDQFYANGVVCDPCITNCIQCSNGVSCTFCGYGYYANSICQPCDANCGDCSSFSTNCIDCLPGKFLFNHNCITNCPISTWVNGNKCNLCINNCLECSDDISCSKCSLSFYFSGNECLACSTNCEECIDSSTCSKCLNSKYLQKGICVDNCEEGYFKYENNLICHNCDSSCLTCSGSTNSDCLSCNDRKYLVQKKCLDCDLNCFQCNNFENCLVCETFYFMQDAKCVSKCSNDYFLSSNEQKCIKCHESCAQCKGPLEIDCLDCISTKKILNGTCIGCNASYYLNKITGNCSKCSDNCIICSSNQTCEKCEENFFLLEKNQDFKICSLCQSGYFIKNSYCYPCLENCKVCKGINQCDQCDNKYYYIDSINQCHMKTIIDSKLEVSINSSILILRFNDTYDDYFIKLENNNKKYYSFMIEGISNQNYEYNLKKSSSIEFPLYISSFQNINQNTSAILNFLLNEFDYQNNKYYFIKKTFSIKLNEIKICPDFQYFDKNIKNCIQYNAIEPLLSYTNNPAIIKLSFPLGKIPEMTTAISNFSSIFIENINNSSYTYIIEYLENNDYNIILELNTSIVGRPFLYYKIIIPQDLIDYYNLKIEKNSNKIQLFDIYKLSDSLMNSINNSASLANTGSKISEGAGGLASFFGMGTSVFVRSLMLIELIYLLKFININYPPNAIEIFESKSLNPKVIFLYTFDETLEDQKIIENLFRFYNVSPYFLNNAGEILVQNLLLFTLAILFGFFSGRIEKIKSNSKLVMIFKKIVQFIEKSLKWPLTIFLFLNSLQKLVFYISCSFYFPVYASENGIVSLIMAIFTLIILIFIIIHLTIVIGKIHNFSNKIMNHFNSMDNHTLKTSATMLTSSNFENKKLTFIEAGKPKEIIELSCNPSTATLTSEKFLNPLDPRKKLRSLTRRNSIIVIPDHHLSIFGRKRETDIFSNQTSEEKECISSYKINDGTSEDNSNSTSPNKSRNIFKGENNEKHFNSQIADFGNVPIKMENKNLINRILSFLKHNIIIAIYLLIYIIKDKNKYKDKYGLLHVDFKNNNFFCKYYILFDFLRQCFLSFIVVFFFEKPLINISIILSIQILFLIFMIILKPFKNKILFFSTILFEMITSVAIASSFTISIMDTIENYNTEDRLKMGWIIIYSNITLLYCFIVCGILIIVSENVSFENLKKKFRSICFKSKKVVPMK